MKKNPEEKLGVKIFEKFTGNVSIMKMSGWKASVEADTVYISNAALGFFSIKKEGDMLKGRWKSARDKIIKEFKITLPLLNSNILEPYLKKIINLS